ncbi:hypothetical protein BO71DRAFT_403087 [Aspergillus ellipticus CBS 707.79]|uniref:Uncharacterized protein n=1 Tax=Aspergillus ellipticus CBS 707.79 TaxID=1448320 RepID=A0A319DEC8_9EURO|nr:hypothetical protein BO71DRAFT_403087 [Aspergillus ellipticus CBS 707.79]
MIGGDCEAALPRMSEPGSDGTLTVVCVGWQCFETRAGTQIWNTRQAHRMVRMVMKPYDGEEEMQAREDEYTQDCRPSVAELTVLLSWMLAGMWNALPQDCHARNRALRFHLVVPTLVLSFVRPARVRVLYGYFDETLKIQATVPQDFNVPEYPVMMNYLVRWAHPDIAGDTRTPCLPPISEDDEASDEGSLADQLAEAMMTSGPWCSSEHLSSPTQAPHNESNLQQLDITA